MADIISVDYEKMKAVANTFDQESSQVKSVLTNITNQIQVLKNGGWLADAATAYYQEMDNDVCPGINRLVQAMTQSAQVCRNICTLLDSAEQEAAGLIPKQ